MESFFGAIRRWVTAHIILAFAATNPAFAAPKMKIGFIGVGNIGSTLAKFWADAGYQVMISARDLEAVAKEAAEIGPNVSAGTPAQAAVFGQVVVISVRWSAFADIAQENAVARHDLTRPAGPPKRALASKQQSICLFEKAEALQRFLCFTVGVFVELVAYRDAAHAEAKLGLKDILGTIGHERS